VKLLKRWRWHRLERDLRNATGDSALPDPTLPVNAAPLLAIDLEMTGLDPASDAIVSIGWVPVDMGAINLAGASEVGLKANPSSSYGRSADQLIRRSVAQSVAESVGQSAAIHGIRDCDRIGGLEPSEAFERLMQALAGRIAVFHHAPLDTAFLHRAMKNEFGIGWRTPWIDTLDWFRRRQADRDHDDAGGSTRLEAVRECFGLDARSSHNALDDAISCAEVALVLAAHSRARLIDACRLPRG